MVPAIQEDLEMSSMGIFPAMDDLGHRFMLQNYIALHNEPAYVEARALAT